MAWFSLIRCGTGCVLEPRPEALVGFNIPHLPSFAHSTTCCSLRRLAGSTRIDFWTPLLESCPLLKQKFGRVFVADYTRAREGSFSSTSRLPRVMSSWKIVSIVHCMIQLQTANPYMLQGLPIPSAGSRDLQSRTEVGAGGSPASRGSSVTVKVKRSTRNPVDTSQVRKKNGLVLPRGSLCSTEGSTAVGTGNRRALGREG